MADVDISVYQQEISRLNAEFIADKKKLHEKKYEYYRNRAGKMEEEREKDWLQRCQHSATAGIKPQTAWDYVQDQYLPVTQLYVSELVLYEVKKKNIVSRTVHSLAHIWKDTMDSLRRVLNKNK